MGKKARPTNPNHFTEEQTREAARKTVSKEREVSGSAYVGRVLTVVAPNGDARPHIVEKTRRQMEGSVLEFLSGGHVFLTVEKCVADIMLQNGVYAFPGGVKYVLAPRKPLKDEQLALLDKAAGFLNRNMQETNFHLTNAVKRETISQALVSRDARKLKSLLNYHVRALERLMDRIQKEIIDKEGE